MLNELAYRALRFFIFLVQLLPLRLVAFIGRCIGQMVYWFDRRHRRVARNNMRLCFPEKSEPEIVDLLAENFRRIGENFASAIKTSTMPFEKLGRHFEVIGIEKWLRAREEKSRVVAIGHFGNFEIYARMASMMPGFQGAATFRGLDNQIINRLLIRLREKSGCLFFDRRKDVSALKEAMNKQAIILGLLADQHGGDSALVLPFFGHPAATNAAPAVMALRYRSPLFTAFCFRTKLGFWRIEVGDEIPLYENGAARPISDIMLDVNRAIEQAIRKDPANWFWVHNRWKVRGKLAAQAEAA